MEQQVKLMHDENIFQKLDVIKADLEYDREKISSVLNDGKSIETLPIDSYVKHKALLAEDLSIVELELERVEEEFVFLKGDNRVEQIEASLWAYDEMEDTRNSG